DRPREVEVPEDLAEALAPHAEARAFFDGLSYTHRKEYVQWIAAAKRPETRRRRIEKAVAMLRDGRKSRQPRLSRASGLPVLAPQASERLRVEEVRQRSATAARRARLLRLFLGSGRRRGLRLDRRRGFR